jgi:CheY-like chemotaxis protein
MLPGKSGLQVSAAIKSRPEYRRIPIILLSGAAPGSEEELKARSFADAFVAKPCKARDLLGVIDDLLGKRG